MNVSHGAGLLSFSFSVAIAETQPNVIIFLTDDLGYSCVSCCGAKKVNFPFRSPVPIDEENPNTFFRVTAEMQ